MIKIQGNNKGFTLLELVVTAAVFVFVVLIGIGSFLSILNVQRKASSLITAQDNIRFALEYMIREIRMGESYHCGPPEGNTSPLDCDFSSGGSSLLNFINSSDQTVTYKLDTGRLQKSVVGGSTDYISSLDITFNNLAFYVTGSAANNQKQPKVTITAEVEAGAGTTKSTFNLQTTVSQRPLDS